MDEQQREQAWRFLFEDQPKQALMYVDFAVSQVVLLPQYAHDKADVDPVVQTACLEAFMINVRLIAEFFAWRPDDRDWRATDLLPEWVVGDPIKSNLTQWHKLASQHVAHLSKTRTPGSGEVDPVDTSEAALRAIADECRRVYATFQAQWIAR